jgi:hypothetical protein
VQEEGSAKSMPTYNSDVRRDTIILHLRDEWFENVKRLVRYVKEIEPIQA